MGNFKKFITLWVKDLKPQVGLTPGGKMHSEVIQKPVWVDMDNVVCIQEQAIFESKENEDLRNYLKEHNIDSLFIFHGKGFILANVIEPVGKGYFDILLKPTI